MLPPIRDGDHGLVEAVKGLLAVNARPERPGKVALILDGLRKEKGPAVIPLLAALERRALLAAQTPGVPEAVAPSLSDASPAVREQGAKTLHALLAADYLDQPELREGAVSVLAKALERPDPNVAARVALFRALGAAGRKVLDDRSARSRLEGDALSTFAEQDARLRAVGQLEMPGQGGAVMALLKGLPLDSNHSWRWTTGASTVRSVGRSAMAEPREATCSTRSRSCCANAR